MEIRRTKSLILKLCVCNPITGEVDVLPHLRGSDRPPRLYACALLTVDDLQYFNLGNDEDDHYTTSPSSYRVVLMYNRRGFTAARWFASGSGQWGAEVRAEGARAGRMRQHTAAAMVVWPRLKLALLRLPKAGVRGVYRTEGSLLGSLPYGRLCWAEVSWDKTRIRVFFTHHHHYHGLADMMVSLLESPYSGQRWQRERSVVIPRSSCHCQRVKLRWFCEKSGLILFTADYRCYTLNLETMEVDMVAGFGIQGDVDNMCGYEIDRVALLSSLAHISST